MRSKKYPESKPHSSSPSKVAESVAGYTTSPAVTKRKSLAKIRRIAGLEASDEVWKFAQEHQLMPHLETAIGLVKESFRDLRSIHLAFDPDPEEPNLDGIIIQIKTGESIEEREKQYRAYALRFIQEVPNDVRGKICLFYY
jgi:hypothetical protein